MSGVDLRASWSYRGQDRWAERDRLLRLVEALRPIHALLQEFSWSGKRSGWKPMLEQPLLQEVTDAQWNEKILQDDGRILVRQFWNRRIPKDEALSIHLSIFDPAPDYFDHTRSGGGVSLRCLPDALLTEPILTAMLEAVIATMEPDRAEIGTMITVKPRLNKAAFSDDELALIQQRMMDTSRPDRAEWLARWGSFYSTRDTPVWRFWLACGKPWPKPGMTWLESWQSELADVEVPYLGGTLYTWHKYAPWNLPVESEWQR